MFSNFVNFHSAQRYSVTTVALNCYNFINATQGKSGNLRNARTLHNDATNK